MLVNYAYASNHIQTAQGFLVKINDAVLFPLLILLTATAVLVFLFGVFEYVKNSDSQDGRTTGGRHILWGIVGIVIMLAAYTILSIAAGSFNLRGQLNQVSTQSPISDSGSSFTLPQGGTSSSGGSSSGSDSSVSGGGLPIGSYVINGVDFTYFYNELVSNGLDPTSADNTVRNIEFIPSTVISSSYTNGFISLATRNQLLQDVQSFP